MVKIRIIDTDGKDEIHTAKKATFVGDRLWIYDTNLQYYIPTNTIEFMQFWEER